MQQTDLRRLLLHLISYLKCHLLPVFLSCLLSAMMSQSALSVMSDSFGRPYPVVRGIVLIVIVCVMMTDVLH